MNRYVALLRGVNVAGHRALKMVEIKAIFEELGFEKVVTYLQSGNVVFSTRKSIKGLKNSIERAIEETVGYAVSVLVIDKQSFIELAASNPLWETAGLETAFFHMTFLFGIPESVPSRLPKQGEEEATLSNGHFYLYCPHGYGRTKLNNSYFERSLKVVATTRNWKTVSALVALLKSS